ncbi:hypothetical protein [Arthrobacter crystallopoietes]|uniref:Uncharacterized protein n=1 Tax=Crystallibacter crystallopoietes TaxID=37928 RepID=A0A1H1BTD3_9MICC|nr:hypothetical protein [Arthrobacter crystallopoietes]AUI51026.1 hypothetical protein AC20117_09555 [Arthrobacter crystallopoietes]SDQ55177.1 hypothetical protein SAMN04489742_1560 [Arthrobacter crystallopoietes]
MAEDSSAEDKPKLLGLNGAQTIASALAAVTSAFAGSFLGVAGTLIGAALGSVIATVAAAIYARTLSSAAVAARKTLPVPRLRGLRNGGLPASDDGTERAGVPSAVADFKAKLTARRFTPRTWVKIGVVSAASFLIAMAGITMIELGTSKPISALVASSTSSTPAAEQQTTLGRVLTGTAAPAEDGSETTEPGEAEPGQVDDGAGQTGTTGETSGDTSGTDGSAMVEDPATDQTDGTGPVETVPEPVPAPGSETGEVAEPEVVTDSGAGQQDAGQEAVPDDSGAVDPAPVDSGLTEGDQTGTEQ